jgi:hypothetical protein
MRFLKIKIKKTDSGKDKFEFKYEVQNKAGDWNEFEFRSLEAPTPSFLLALKNLACYVREICEQQENFEDRITVRGVSFAYAGENEVMGATMNANMTLLESNSPLQLNTPYKASQSYSENTPEEAITEQLLPEGCTTALLRLTAEAEKYINGERAANEGQESFDYAQDGEMDDKKKEKPATESTEENGQMELVKEVMKNKKVKKGAVRFVKDIENLVNDPKSGVTGVSITSGGKETVIAEKEKVKKAAERDKRFYLGVFGGRKLVDFWGEITEEEQAHLLELCGLPVDYDVYSQGCPYLDSVLSLGAQQ